MVAQKTDADKRINYKKCRRELIERKNRLAHIIAGTKRCTTTNICAAVTGQNSRSEKQAVRIVCNDLLAFCWRTPDQKALLCAKDTGTIEGFCDCLSYTIWPEDTKPEKFADALDTLLCSYVCM